MSFRQEGGGKQVFLSVDSRSILHNPLYQAFKAKSFTRGDLLLHFYLLDLLAEGERLSVRELMAWIVKSSATVGQKRLQTENANGGIYADAG